MASSWASLCLPALTLAILPRQSLAIDEDSALQQALGSQQPLYKFPAAAITTAVTACASRDPGHAGIYVAMVLHSGRDDAAAIAPSLVTAAIQGLGTEPRPDLVGDVVHDSVTAAPSEVLPIVSAAVKASPRSAARAIVSAAIKAVPHPEQVIDATITPVAGITAGNAMVSAAVNAAPHPGQMVDATIAPVAERTSGGDKQIDGKEVDDKQLAAPSRQLTVAEAIVQTALAADPGLSAQDLEAAVDEGLTSTQTGILTTVLDPVVPNLPPVSP